jgi:hypothetical protein
MQRHDVVKLTSDIGFTQMQRHNVVKLTSIQDTCGLIVAEFLLESYIISY